MPISSYNATSNSLSSNLSIPFMSFSLTHSCVLINPTTACIVYANNIIKKSPNCLALTIYCTGIFLCWIQSQARIHRCPHLLPWSWNVTNLESDIPEPTLSYYTVLLAAMVVQRERIQDTCILPTITRMLYEQLHQSKYINSNY